MPPSYLVSELSLSCPELSTFPFDLSHLALPGQKPPASGLPFSCFRESGPEAFLPPASPCTELQGDHQAALRGTIWPSDLAELEISELSSAQHWLASPSPCRARATIGSCWALVLGPALHQKLQCLIYGSIWALSRKTAGKQSFWRVLCRSLFADSQVLSDHSLGHSAGFQNVTAGCPSITGGLGVFKCLRGKNKTLCLSFSICPGKMIWKLAIYQYPYF